MRVRHEGNWESEGTMAAVNGAPEEPIATSASSRQPLRGCS